MDILKEIELYFNNLRHFFYFCLHVGRGFTFFLKKEISSLMIFQSCESFLQLEYAPC